MTVKIIMQASLRVASRRRIDDQALANEGSDVSDDSSRSLLHRYR